MFSGPMPWPVLIFSVISFLCYLRKTSLKKRYRPRSTKYLKFPKTDPERVKRIVDAHKDYESKELEILCINPERIDISMKYSPGDKVSIGFKDEDLAVFIEGCFISNVFDYKLKSLIKDGVEYEAFIYDRDMSCSVPGYTDSFQVIVFYKNNNAQ